MRIELLIATLALLASAAASIATVVQTSAVSKQLSASVWPYLSIESTHSPDEIALDVINQGLGPAIVRGVVLTVDGIRLVRWRDAFRAISLAGRPVRNGNHMTLHEHDFGTGSVVRAGETARLISLHSSLVEKFEEGDRARVDLTVCYCSILQQCWTVEESSVEQPHPVADCGHGVSIVTY